MLSIIRTKFSDDDKRGVCIFGQDFKRNDLAQSIKCSGGGEGRDVPSFSGEVTFKLVLRMHLRLPSRRCSDILTTA